MKHRFLKFDLEIPSNREQQTSSNFQVMEKSSVHVPDKLLKVGQTSLDKPRRIKIFSLNCYMVSDLALSAYERQFCCDKPERAQRIGKFATQHDVVCYSQLSFFSY